MLRTDTGYLVVDVKPEALLVDPDVAAVLDWTGRICEAKGWAFGVWTGADPVLLRNAQFLAAARRTHGVDEAVLGKFAEALQPGRVCCTSW